MPTEQEKNLFLQAQTYQQQMHGVLMQKEVVDAQLSEIKHALEELEKTTETDVYKLAGTVIVRSPKEAVKKELVDRRGSLEAMGKTLDASEKKLKAKIEELRDRFSAPDGKAAE